MITTALHPLCSIKELCVYPSLKFLRVSTEKKSEYGKQS